MTKCPKCQADSATQDFCDQCGAALAGSSAPLTPAPTKDAQSAAGGEACPNCGEIRFSTERHCEACGYDFVDRVMPEAPDAQPAQSDALAVSADAVVASGWWALASSDKDWFQLMEPNFAGNNFVFPDDYPTRSFPLDDAQEPIGLQGKGGVDLSSEPIDRGVSRKHAMLMRQSDGTYQLIDHGSSNGTYLNGAAQPLAKGVAVPINNGDYIQIGVWTRITFEKR